MKATIKYKAGHSYTDEWLQTDLYCLNCGKKGLWRCNNGGDYYAGETYACTHCDHTVSLPSEPDKADYTYQQAIDQIKTTQSDNQP